MESIVAHAYAKINLGLNVLHKRTDGYHAIETIFQQIDLYDKLIFTTQEEGFQLDCAMAGKVEDNLIYRAYQLLKEDFSVMKGLSVLVEKHIPVAAGLAGGSADGAATLLALNELYALDLSETALARYGLELGSDVPFMLRGGTALGRGRGEILKPIKALVFFGVLLNPGFPVSTAEIYQSLQLMPKEGSMESMVPLLEAGDWQALAKELTNDLGQSLLKKHPSLQPLLDAVKGEGAFLAMPSGSGPTIFGLFDTESKARRAVDRLGNLAPYVYYFQTCPQGHGVELERI